MLWVDQIKLTPILFVIMELFEPLLNGFVRWDENTDKLEMRQEVPKDLFDFIIGKIF